MYVWKFIHVYTVFLYIIMLFSFYLYFLYACGESFSFVDLSLFKSWVPISNIFFVSRVRWSGMDLRECQHPMVLHCPIEALVVQEIELEG